MYTSVKIGNKYLNSLPLINPTMGPQKRTDDFFKKIKDSELSYNNFVAGLQRQYSQVRRIGGVIDRATTPLARDCQYVWYNGQDEATWPVNLCFTKPEPAPAMPTVPAADQTPYFVRRVLRCASNMMHKSASIRQTANHTNPNGVDFNPLVDHNEF